MEHVRGNELVSASWGGTKKRTRSHLFSHVYDARYAHTNILQEIKMILSIHTHTHTHTHTHRAQLLRGNVSREKYLRLIRARDFEN